MANPGVLVLTGYGINCDEETRYAFEKAGARATIVHINDLIDNKRMLSSFQIFVFPGGFSYGDDTGSGKALAGRIINNLRDEFFGFIQRDTLMLGICNGFQVMVNIGVVPALASPIGTPEVSLEHNSTSRYECRWVDLRIEKGSKCVFTAGIDFIHVPVAHGEGRFYAPESIYECIETNGQIVMRYSLPDGSPANGTFPFNPNGAVGDIAAICDRSGRIMGMMPHPERNIFFTQRDDWTHLKEKFRREGTQVPDEGDGMIIFKNAVRYFM